jgi:hypothetical protein
MADLVADSDRLFRRLVRAYPPAFQSEYGDEMALAFRDACRQRFRQHGPAGLAGQWIETIPDFVVSVTDEHAGEGFRMVKTMMTQALAVAGIVGGALWIAFSAILLTRAPGIPGGAYRQTEDLTPLLMLGVGLTAAGLIGVYRQPARQWPAFSRWMLLAAAAGGVWALGSSFVTQNFLVMLAGFLAQVLGLLLAGLTLLARPAARSWALLLIAWAGLMFLFNTEDWRAAFGVATGIAAIALFASTLGNARQPADSPLSAA